MKTKALISCAVTVQLICVFVFAYAKSRFSHNKAHMITLLAHLSRRLIGELIVYQWSGVRRPSSASSTMLKHLLLRNRLADQSQILCGPSLGRGNDILFTASGSHDQDGRHAHIWSKPFKNLLLQNRQADFHETWYVASGTPAHHSLFK